MIDWLRKIFRRSEQDSNSSTSKSTRAAGFQLATTYDANYIFESILSEAKNGHFNKDYLVPLMQPFLMEQINSCISNHLCPIGNGKQLESSIYVFIEKCKPVGFGWVRATENTGEKELYLFAVSPTHRNLGIGKVLATKAILSFPIGTTFCARLYPKSKTMLDMLTKIGFKRGKKQGNNTVFVSYVSC